MRTARVVLVTVGTAVMAYGGWLLVRLGWDNLMATVPWLVAAVLLHDGVWAPVVLVVAALGGARLSRPWATPAMVGAVVLVTVTVAVVPMLGRYGAEPTNTSLLDRPYLQNWVLFAAVVVLGVLLGRLVHGRWPRRDGGRPPDGAEGAG